MLARDSFSYLHLAMVAGIVLLATVLPALAALATVAALCTTLVAYESR